MSSHHQETPAQPVEIDAWHEPHGVAPMQEHGSHVNIRFLLIFFVAIVLFILVTVAALFVFFAHSQTNLRTKLVENTYEYETQYMPYATEAKGRIGEYGWVDRQAPSASPGMSPPAVSSPLTADPPAMQRNQTTKPKP